MERAARGIGAHALNWEHNTTYPRKDARAQVAMVARYRSPVTFEYVVEECFDVSVGGMFVRSANPAAAGTLLKLECDGDQPGSKFLGAARVVWVRREADAEGPTGMGIKFVRLDAKGRAAIEDIVKRAMQKSMPPTAAPSVAPAPIAKAKAKSTPPTAAAVEPVAQAALAEAAPIAEPKPSSVSPAPAMPTPPEPVPAPVVVAPTPSVAPKPVSTVPPAPAPLGKPASVPAPAPATASAVSRPVEASRVSSRPAAERAQTGMPWGWVAGGAIVIAAIASATMFKGKDQVAPEPAAAVAVEAPAAPAAVEAAPTPVPVAEPVAEVAPQDAPPPTAAERTPTAEAAAPVEPAPVAPTPAPEPEPVPAAPTPAPAAKHAAASRSTARKAAPPAASSAPTGKSALAVATACQAHANHACVIEALDGKAISAREYELLIDSLRASGRTADALGYMERYTDRFPSEPAGIRYRRVLAARWSDPAPAAPTPPSAAPEAPKDKPPEAPAPEAPAPPPPPPEPPAAAPPTPEPPTAP